MYGISEQAQEIIDLERLDVDGLVQAAGQALERPSDSGWWDEELWNTHTLLFGTPDWELTEDYLWDYSNYRRILEDLQAKFPDDVEDAAFGHWTYSRFVAVKVRVLDEDGNITGAFAKAYAIGKELEDYPIYDEQDVLGLENECQEREVAAWAEQVGLDKGVVFEAWAEDDIYVEGYGSEFHIGVWTMPTDYTQTWEEREQAMVAHILHKRDERAAVAAGQTALEGA